MVSTGLSPPDVKKNTEIYILFKRMEGQMAIRWCGDEVRRTGEQLAKFDDVYSVISTQTQTREVTACRMVGGVFLLS